MNIGDVKKAEEIEYVKDVKEEGASGGCEGRMRMEDIKKKEEGRTYRGKLGR